MRRENLLSATCYLYSQGRCRTFWRLKLRCCDLQPASTDLSEAKHLRPMANNATQVEAKIRAIIADKLGVEESEIVREASFTEDLGADSLDTVELIMEFEKEFNISIPDEDADQIATVSNAIAYVIKKAA